MRGAAMMVRYKDGSVEVRRGRWICPRCGLRNDDNLPVVVGDGIETGGCRECFDDCGRSDFFAGSIVLEVLTGESVSVPVWW